MIIRFDTYHRMRTPVLEFVVDKLVIIRGKVTGRNKGQEVFSAGIDQHNGETVYYFWPPTVPRRCKRNRMEIEE